MGAAKTRGGVNTGMQGHIVAVQPIRRCDRRALIRQFLINENQYHYIGKNHFQYSQKLYDWLSNQRAGAFCGVVLSEEERGVRR
jgi:hypothetical protein